MTAIESIIAKRYAKAYLDIFHKDIDASFIAATKELAVFLKQHHAIIFFLKLTHIAPDIKLRGLQDLFVRYKVQALEPLARLLLKDKRLFLLPGILKQLELLYKQRHGILDCVISSSHALSQESLDHIAKFLARVTGCAIMYTYKVDKNLIAGLRLYSDTLLWEYSIRKQLRNIELSLIR